MKTTPREVVLRGNIILYLVLMTTSEGEVGKEKDDIE
jgi:hypothetical protein